VKVEAAPTASGVRDAAELIERLGRLRVWAGKPSLRRLSALAGTTSTSDGYVVDRLPPSTVSDVLAGKRLPHLPRMELVGAFVEACLQACEVPPSAIEKLVDHWLTEWRRLAGLTPAGDEGGVDTPVRPAAEVAPSGVRPLVGRDEALRAFDRALDEMADGRSQFVAVTGEPGAGKTRLLGELAAAAADRELPALWGRAGEFEQEMPLGVVVDALDDGLEGRDAWVRERLGEEQARQLSAVLPSLSATADEPMSAKRGPARYRVHRAVRRLLEELAAQSGLVLILDDVHWADAASVELIDHLLRHPPRGRVLLAVGHRPAQVAPQLTALLEADFGHVRQVPANPLTLAEVEEFVGPSAGRAWCRTLHAASSGNALYLEALARMGRRDELTGGRVDLDENLDRATELPYDIRAAMEVELRGVSPRALLVAQAAAVVASEFEPSVVAVAAEVDDDAVLTGLDELSERDIVRLTAPGGRFQFRHPLIRNVAYGLGAPGWRLAAHARIAKHLADIGAPPTARACHLERSARFGDREAVTVLIRAARGASRHAPPAAVHWLSAALRLLPAENDDFRLDLLLELARLQTLTGRAVDGRETTEEVLRSAPSDDYVRRARAIRFATMMERQDGDPNKIRLLLLDELRRIPDPESAAAVPLHLRLVEESLLRSDFRRAQAILERLPDSDDRWEPGLSLAIAAMRPLPALAGLRIPDAIRYVEVAGRMEAEVPDELLAEWLESISWLCWTETFIGRPQSAHRRLERAVTVARATGHYSVASLMAGQARTHTMLGQLASAAVVAEEAAEEARLLRLTVAQGMAQSQQCLAASWSGDDEAALRFGDGAVNVPEHGQWPGSLAQYARAVALINAGRLDEGTAAMREACSRDPRLDPLTQLYGCELMAYAEMTRGRTDEAITWADRADRLTHPDLEITLGLARLARAHALRERSPIESAEHARRAAATLTALGLPIDAGRATLNAGICRAALGEVRLAREELHQAARTFAACGARGLYTEATRRQQRIT
jgi:tetratricopeptide (TPR) repeat protein